jgi:hypothetical protein
MIHVDAFFRAYFPVVFWWIFGNDIHRNELFQIGYNCLSELYVLLQVDADLMSTLVGTGLLIELHLEDELLLQWVHFNTAIK